MNIFISSFTTGLKFFPALHEKVLEARTIYLLN